MDIILSITDLNLSFVSAKQSEESLFLFRNLSMEIPREKVTAIIGGNGAGKTTLFNVISGLEKRSYGKINFNNRNILGLTPHLISQIGIGRLFQGARIFEEISILDNMLLGAAHFPSEQPFYTLFMNKTKRKREKDLLDRAESIFINLFKENNIFWERRYDQAGLLSFGQQRLLALARLMMGNYSLFLLDEPTAGVNQNYVEKISETIEHMNHQNHKTVLLIEHNMQFVRQNAQYCHFMSEGKIISSGDPKIVLAQEIVQQTYMGF